MLIRIIIPVHDRPFPTSPGLQVQIKEPAVFIQFASLSQVWLPSSHSLMSNHETTVLRTKLIMMIITDYMHAESKESTAITPILGSVFKLIMISDGFS